MSSSGNVDRGVAKTRADRMAEALDEGDMETARDMFEHLTEFFEEYEDDA